jgi:GT2 family glycosyltransferase
MIERKFKLLVGIPTINRADLLNEALAHYFEDFASTEIVICDNGNQDIITREKMFVIYRPTENLNVSGSWNMLMDYAIKTNATHVLMLNDDVYLGKNETEIISLIKNNKDLHFINSLMNWSSFILSVDGFNKIGAFDELCFPNYYNDNDYCYRMRLLGLERLNTPFLNPVIYRNSMTIAKDPSLNNRFLEYRQNYINKWGGLPSEEKYITKYNKI